MHRNKRRKSTRRSVGVSLLLACAACIPEGHSADYRFGYSHGFNHLYGKHGIHDHFRLRRELDQLDEQMRRQQRQLDRQMRQQQEQTRLLREQQSARHRLTARQACHYRLNGGLDLCDRLFDTASEKQAACVETVMEMNPGCAPDTAEPAIKPGG